MSLEAEIARIQLNSLPAPIVERLLRRRDVSNLIQMGSAEVGDLGQFRFSDLREAMAAAPLNAFVAISSPNGAAISVARSPDAMVRVRAPSGAESTLPALALLDPSAEVRLEGVRYLSEHTLPQWPCSQTWKDLVALGPLADSDFGVLLDELAAVAEPALDGVISKIERGSFQVHDLIPTHRIYYESLLGPAPTTMEVSRYAADILVPHLAGVARKNAAWGLRCIRAASVADAVDPVLSAADVSSSDLLSAIESIGIGITPFALLATYRLAVARKSADERFSSIAQRALESLAARTANSEPESGLDTLFVALVRLTLGVVGNTEELAWTPPFWRRLVAFAHATVVLEAIHLPDVSAKEIGAWCIQRRTREGAASEILDHLTEPGWRSDAFSARDLWATALLRAIEPASEAPRVPALSPAQLAPALPQVELVQGLPGPLGGARRDWTTSNAQVKDSDLLDGVDSPTAEGEVIPPVAIWSALAHHAQIYRFSSDLLVRLRGLAKTLKSQPPKPVSGIYTPLALCCNVASTQGDLELADIAASEVIEACGGCTDPSEAILAASIVVLAAGAAKDRSASLEWAGDRLLALAYRLPRGACCAALAETIAIFQRLIPLSERRWGKALIVASSATP